ncbi:hypothetical protein ABD91_03130 [Lysinibacillus sphaericus]|uniref:Ig-like domain-containing protein n=1 Tax=Lysinibacillus sphaericus TaxID=1421 RepID=UPI0018CE4F60|nr:Ig-like domain-containing protein [Lysinibacillus sphaericus]MBG9689912.1 hypothetical protein [Lysinibacillus sphaericus]
MKELLKKVAIITIAILLLLVNIPPSIMWNDNVENNVQAAPSKPTGSSGSYKIDVEAKSVKANPSVYWTQIDDLSFTAVSDGGTTPGKNSGDNEPVATKVKNTLDLTNYSMPTTFKDSSTNKSYLKSELTRVYLKDDSVKFKDAQSFKGISLKKASDTKFTFLTETGSPNKPTTKTQYGQNSDGKPKYSVRYDTPIDIVWYGEIDKQAEMRVVEDSSLPVGEKKTFKAQVRTNDGNSSWSSWKDVSAYQWTSDASEVATVSSSGEITTKKIGNTKITATWKDDNFHLHASATVKVIGDNGLAVAGSSNTCFKDGSTTLKAELYKDGVSSDVTNTATWTSSDTSVATVVKGVVTFKKNGITTIKATVSNMSDILELSVTDCSVPPVEEDPNPPTVEIYGSNKVKSGEEFQLYASASVEGGTIDRYEWDFHGADGGEPKDANLNGLYYLEEGEKYVTVSVEDNQNRWAHDDHIIEVTAPTPVANIRITGTLKQNRKVIIDGAASNSPRYFPLIPSKTNIEIKPLDGQDIATIKYKGSLKGVPTKDAIFKQPGRYEATIYVENEAGLSDTMSTIFTILPDLPPVVDFDTVTLIYREPSENLGEYAKAKIVIQNNSYSLDGDPLNYFVYNLSFDSSNDDSFKDTFSIKSADYEQNKYYTISNATSDNQYKIKIDEEYNLEVITPFVGKNRLELEGWECFGDSCSKYPIKK